VKFIHTLMGKLQRHPKRVVFPEGSDERILQAARQFVTKRLGVPLLVGDRAQIREHARRLDISLEGMRLIQPDRSSDRDFLAERYFEIRQAKGMTLEAAREQVLDNNIFAAMMLGCSMADALIGGATTQAKSALVPLFRCVPRLPEVVTASSMMILEIERAREFGVDGNIFVADCAVIPNPDSAKLADVALTTSLIARHLTNAIPKVAMLSFSTKSDDSRHPSVRKMAEAAQIARERAPLFFPSGDIEIDGEMQADAALDRYAAKMKGVDGPVAGKANVLIFPDLDSGNIAAKMVQTLAGGYAYGQIITGLTKPAAEISRGASAHDIFSTAVIVASQAIDRQLLFARKES